MTDITELAQSLKAAAEKATQGNWRAFQYNDGRCGIGGGHHDEIMVCEHISKERPHDAMFIALANPANVLALVEALEKAQQLATQQGNIACALFDEVTAQRQRIAELESQLKAAENNEIDARCHIAELESRTVKIPYLPDDCDRIEAHFKYQVAINAAGIKVEAE